MDNIWEFAEQALEELKLSEIQENFNLTECNHKLIEGTCIYCGAIL